MLASRIKQGDTVGIICPSHIIDWVKYNRVAYVLEHLGYKVKFGANVEKDTDGYTASAEERAYDLNAMVSDSEVKMIFFGGGDGALEILPLIDYNNIRRYPKIFCSFSDATSILNAIHAQTGLVTYYGPGAKSFADLRYYNYLQFCAHFVEGCSAAGFESDSDWTVLTGGQCEGNLIGGYIVIFNLMLMNGYFKFEDKDYILFIEDHEHFNTPNAVNTYLSSIEQSAFMKNVRGVIFGHYADVVPEELLNRLRRFGEKNSIPVVYTDDFGHGTRQGIFPIGVMARLDADGRELSFL